MNKQKINRERVRELVEALRSGKYKQTTKQLKSIDQDTKDVSYCCLGVACEISGLSKWKHEELDPIYINDSYNLPKKVLKHYGFDSESPKVYVPDVSTESGYTEQYLTELNDAGVSFNKIADLIEQTYLTDS